MLPRRYTVASVTSADGTTIAYREFGQGPGLVLVHGGMMAAQNFVGLAGALADSFRVYVPDRRGRGQSGPFGDNHSLRTEVEDLEALLAVTGSHDVFGLSAGAVIALQSALELSAIHRLALYEPPLYFRDAPSTFWVPRYEREMAQGKVASAFVTAMKGTGDPGGLLARVPRWLMVPLMALAFQANAKDVKDGDVAIRDLVPTLHHDARLVAETEGALERYRNVRADVLLLGGSKSAAYLHTALDRLGAVLPRVRRVNLAGVGHTGADNDGKPALVAAELRRFFAPHPAP